MSIAIGLDFGSLNYRAAYMLNNEIVSIPKPRDEAGIRTWLGMILLEPTPNNSLGFTFSNLKYQIGKRYDWKGRNSSLLPEDTVKDIFVNIKRAIEIYAGEEISSAVLAVPALYPASKRAIVRRLAEEAGFGKIDLINDCTAAALAHTYDEEADQAKTLLLYSMGVTGFEVSLIRSARQHLRELFHEGTKSPSGGDFDIQIMATIIEMLQQENIHLPTKVLTNQWFEFRQLAYELKERFAVHEREREELILPSHITGTEEVRLALSDQDFESIIKKSQIQVTLDVVEQALEDAGMTPDAVDEVILVGGSTQMGIIQRHLKELFGDKLVLPRDNIIAEGAAVQADRLAQLKDDTVIEVPVNIPIEQVKPEPSLVILPRPTEPDFEPLLAYAREIANAGESDKAIVFLEELEQRSRLLREQLS
ncbi:hypothetical protein PN36_26710 [Candidatus Thiomargarita nelsonii]|uniref:Molecular chaperone DnaK n=1 Tax=Candidatus Thiomargarita nelsonii TaxID=1003181 RepID=A0A0A6PCC1_9GAMM|nr:hypothetical protein PN36_26710 [Candidatus Thiomargarita nelsonii]